MAVQAIHAGIEASRRFLSPEANHPHLVLCSVASEARLLAAADHLFRSGIPFVLFREPDQRNAATAMATAPLSGPQRALMSRYRCLQDSEFPSVPETERESRDSRGDGPLPVSFPEGV
jgi:hypothetical protein